MREELEIEKWVRDNGDQTHRINYDLNEDSVVFDVGGYVGDWSALIAQKYDCHIYIFEPVTSFYNQIVERFKGNHKVKVYNFGLSSKGEVTRINMEGNKTSIHKQGGNSEEVVLKSMASFIQENGGVDLIKINIEGGEYGLLQHMIDEDIINSFDNIQVQFHNFIDDCDGKRDHLRKQFAETHSETYCYYFVWENWKRK